MNANLPVTQPQLKEDLISLFTSPEFREVYVKVILKIINNKEGSIPNLRHRYALPKDCSYMDIRREANNEIRKFILTKAKK